MVMDAEQQEPDVTQLLHLWHNGDRSALSQLMEALYPHLHKIAANRLRGYPPEATISPTELLHEAWIRIAQSQSLQFDHRASFYGAAAVMMRNILVDRARARKAAKRSGNLVSGGLPLEVPTASTEIDLDLEGVGRAIEALEQVCERQARQVDLRFFVGFSAAETAEVLGVSSATLKRDWVAARMFIKDFIDQQAR
jgi:RNA polymerase sigma factor (TIGR02999 family)